MAQATKGNQILDTEQSNSPVEPEISIIVTAYNVSDYIEQAVYSILDGITSHSREIIIVDDGSTDGTREKIARLAAEIPDIRVIQFEENTPGGVARAANAGIDAAKGAYIGFLDGDDIVLPHTFDRLLSKIKAEGSDIAVCGFERLHTDTGKISRSGDWALWHSMSDTENYTGDDVKKLLRLLPLPWRKIYRTGFLNDHAIRFPEVNIFYEDSLFHWRVCLAAQSATLCNFSGFHYRYARTGQTINAAGNIRITALDFAPDIRALVAQHNCQQCNDAFLAWYLVVLSWVAPVDSAVAGKIQQDVRDMLGPYSIMRIAAMLRRDPSRRGIRHSLTRSFSAVIWLRLGVPYMFRRRVAKRSVTRMESLLIWSLMQIAPRR